MQFSDYTTLGAKLIILLAPALLANSLATSPKQINPAPQIAANSVEGSHTHNPSPQRFTLIINQNTSIIIKPYNTPILPLRLLFRPNDNRPPYIPSI